MTSLILVRHGETDWNLAGRIQGHADRPLNETGRQQADALALALADTGLSAIYSSDLQRASETARAVADHVGQAVNIDPRLREVKQGLWEGLTLAEILQRFPEEWAAREQDPVQGRPPGGESAIEVAARARAAVDEIARACGEARVLVVSHGFSLAILLCLARGVPLAESRRHIPPNAVPIEVEWPAEPHVNLQPAGASG